MDIVKILKGIESLFCCEFKHLGLLLNKIDAHMEVGIHSDDDLIRNFYQIKDESTFNESFRYTITEPHEDGKILYSFNFTINNDKGMYSIENDIRVSIVKGN